MWTKSYPYLVDEEFLKEFDREHLQDQYLQLTLLDWNEDPIGEIQGLATGGSISVNGNSAVRRTCSLSMSIANPEDTNVFNTQNLISIGKKVFLEIGIKNKLEKYQEEYPIIWFPQGIFVFTECSLSSSASQSLTLSAQLKDKMCLLNGECGGLITSTVQFDKIDKVDEYGNWYTTKPTLSQIIVEAVNHFGKEQLGRIIISDLDEKAKLVERWGGNNPIYLIQDEGAYFLTTNKSKYNQSTGIQEFRYGDNVGFTYTDFIYPNELIAKPGDNICTAVLDKIKNLLGNYEYFYDVYGNFIFQEVKNYLNTTQATVEIQNLSNKDYIVDMTKGKSVYDFSDSMLVMSYNNSPQYNRIKNDYVIWGVREDVEQIKHPIRYHLAIDSKPKIGNIYEVYFYTDPDDELEKAQAPLRYDTIDSFPEVGTYGYSYYDEQANKLYNWNTTTQEYEEIIGATLIKIKTTDWRSELYLQGVMAEPLGLDTGYYYAELAAEWPKLYNLKANYDSEEGYYTGSFKQDVLEYPWDVDYWLDFIDSQEAIGGLGVNLIGRRSYSEDKDEYNCVFEQTIPDFILIELDQPDTAQKRQECQNRNQSFIQVDPNIYMNLMVGGIRNSCFEKVKEYLYDFTNYNNSVSMSCIPIYHLEPNTRVTIKSETNHIYGDYLISSFSIPLTISGSMNISATKCTQKL